MALQEDDADCCKQHLVASEVTSSSSSETTRLITPISLTSSSVESISAKTTSGGAEADAELSPDNELSDRCGTKRVVRICATRRKRLAFEVGRT